MLGGEEDLQEHGGWVFQVGAEVLQPASTDGTVDCSVIGTNCHRDEGAFLESETESELVSRVCGTHTSLRLPFL